MKPIQQKDIDSMLLLPSYFESEIYNEKRKTSDPSFLTGQSIESRNKLLVTKAIEME